jgi:hypothetical protein
MVCAREVAWPEGGVTKIKPRRSGAEVVCDGDDPFSVDGVVISISGWVTSARPVISGGRYRAARSSQPRKEAPPCPCLMRYLSRESSTR